MGFIVRLDSEQPDTLGKGRSHGRMTPVGDGDDPSYERLHLRHQEPPGRPAEAI